MRDEFKKCLKNRKIIKFAKAKDKVKIEIKTAKEDLKSAKDFLKSGNFKYAKVLECSFGNIGLGLVRRENLAY